LPAEERVFPFCHQWIDLAVIEEKQDVDARDKAGHDD
jgi:hypothetical protein